MAHTLGALGDELRAAHAHYLVDRGAAGDVAGAIDAAGAEAEAGQHAGHVFVAGQGAAYIAAQALVDALATDNNNIEMTIIKNVNVIFRRGTQDIAELESYHVYGAINNVFPLDRMHRVFLFGRRASQHMALQQIASPSWHRHTPLE